MKIELDDTEIKILCFIADNQEVSIAQLRSVIFLSTHSIRRRLKRLEKFGYINYRKAKTKQPYPPPYLYSIVPEIKMTEVISKKNIILEPAQTLTLVNEVSLLTIYVDKISNATLSSVEISKIIDSPSSTVRSAHLRIEKKGIAHKIKRTKRPNVDFYQVDKVFTQSLIEKEILGRDLKNKAASILKKLEITTHPIFLPEDKDAQVSFPTLKQLYEVRKQKIELEKKLQSLESEEKALKHKLVSQGSEEAIAFINDICS